MHIATVAFHGIDYSYVYHLVLKFGRGMASCLSKFSYMYSYKISDQLVKLLPSVIVTVFWKTDLKDTNTEILFFVCRRKSHSCTLQRHQVLETR